MAGSKIGAALVLVSVVGCAAGGRDGPAGPGEVAFFAGSLSGTDAVFAMSISGRDVVSYACGGADTFQTQSRWYCGQLEGSGGEWTFDQSEDGWSLQALVREDRADIALSSPSGERFELDAPRLVAGTDAQLYGELVGDGAAVGGCNTGVIVMRGDDGAPLTRGTFCEGDRLGQVTPVTPVEPGMSTLGVAVTLRGGPRFLEVHRVH